MDLVLGIILWTIIMSAVIFGLRRTVRGAKFLGRHRLVTAILVVLGYLFAAGHGGIAITLAPVIAVVWVLRGIRRRSVRRRHPRVGRQQRVAPPTVVQSTSEPVSQEVAEDGAAIRQVTESWAAACVAAGICVRDHEATTTLGEVHRLARSSSEGLAAATEVLQARSLRKELRHAALHQVGGTIYRTPLIRGSRYSRTGPVLVVDHLAGLTVEDYQKRVRALADALRVRDLRVAQSVQDQAEGVIRLTLVTRDSLTDPVILDTDAPVMEQASYVPVATREDGRTYALDLANSSSMLVGGVGGSGKSAGMSSMLARMIQRPDVQVIVVDGKGGSDWSWIEPRAAAYTAEDEDLTEAVAVVGSVREIMRHRLKTLKALTGRSNFWHVGASVEMPLIVLLVDEAQTYLDPAEAGRDKDSKDLITTMSGHLSSLVKKGRSAGIITIVMTQKPTADAIPTKIRDNAQIHIAFRVSTDQAVNAVFGTFDVEPDPRSIPGSMPGVAVVRSSADDTLMSSSAQFERVRFHYIDEDDAAHLADVTAHMRRDLSELRPTLEVTTTSDDVEGDD